MKFKKDCLFWVYKPYYVSEYININYKELLYLSKYCRLYHLYRSFGSKTNIYFICG